MTPLQQRMIEDMTVRGLVPSTQRVYRRAVRALAAYYKRRPDTLSTRDIQRYLCMLHEERGLTYSTCNTIVHGLRFFYGTTLGRSAMHFVIPLAKEPSTLPVILSRHDIRQLLATAESLRDQTLLKVTYNAGLRASEVVHLQIAHIDSHRMCLRVAQGKRQKDREALLSPGLLQDLRAYWRVYRPAPWLFPGRDGHSAACPQNRLPHFPAGQRPRRDCQARGVAFTPPRLCHPSPGSRGGSPHHPALDGAYQSADDLTVLTRGSAPSPPDAVASGTAG
jgi:site-specific recombinase XerD